MKKIFLIILFLFFGGNAFAVDIPVMSLVAQENSSGYICSGDTIGCSRLNATYKIEKDRGDISICTGAGFRDCIQLENLYKITHKRDGGILICSPDTIGSCSSISALYKINEKRYDEDVSLVCSGDTIGNCSTISALYKINEKRYDSDISLICPGDTIGRCSNLNATYKFKHETTTTPYSQPTICPENSFLKDGECYCKDGYANYNNKCLPGEEVCNLKYNDKASAEIENGDVYCSCDPEYKWNEDRTKCIEKQEKLSLEEKNKIKKLKDKKEKAERLFTFIEIIILNENNLEKKENLENISVILENKIEEINQKIRGLEN